MNRYLFGERDFAKIDEHLLSGRCIEYMVINAPVFLTCIELTRSFQEVYIVSQSLFISWQAFIISVLDELLFKDIING
jgi:hypothetical protein